MALHLRAVCFGFLIIFGSFNMRQFMTTTSLVFLMLAGQAFFATPAAAQAAAPAAAPAKAPPPAAAPAAASADKAAPDAAEKTPQQNKMALCNKSAEGKKGDERKAFMKECLSAKKPEAQQSKMKTCNAEAAGKKGDERKAFMSECLKK